MGLFSEIVIFVTILVVSSGGNRITPRESIATGDIINGYEAQPHAAPYIVSLKSGSHFCAGSIIDAEWVVTAAHCLTSWRFQVVAGLHNRRDESDAVTRTAERSNYVTHPKYGGGVGPFDIGLIKISPPFEFSDAVQKVALPAQNQSHAGEGNLFGWGKVGNGSLPILLQTVDTMIFGYDQCRRELPFGSSVHPTNVCSNSNKEGESGISACNGDSGGPLVMNADGEAELVGIVSWGYIPCGQLNYPSVYTHTSAHIDWIREKTGL